MWQENSLPGEREQYADGGQKSLELSEIFWKEF
jgi:hypothetical protein